MKEKLKQLVYKVVDAFDTQIAFGVVAGISAFTVAYIVFN